MFIPLSLVPGPFQGVSEPQLGGYPGPRVGTPAGTGVPPFLVELGYPYRDSTEDRRVSTCYAVGGMPLAVMQEDVLV